MHCTGWLMDGLNFSTHSPVGLTQRRIAEALMRIEKPVGLRQRRIAEALMRIEKLFFVLPKKSYKRNATKGLSRPLETYTGYRCSGRFGCGGLILCELLLLRPFNALRQLDKCE